MPDRLDWKWLTISLVMICLTVTSANYLADMVDRKYFPDQAALAREVIDSKGDELEVLFLGSSHLMAGVDPSLLEKTSMNVSLSAGNLKTIFKVYERYSSRLSNLELVVVELSPATLFYDTIEFREDIESYFVPWRIPLWHFSDNPAAIMRSTLSYAVPSARDSGYRAWLTAEEHRKYMQKVDAGFIHFSNSLSSPDKACQDATHHYKLCTDDPLSNMSALEKIINLCRDHGVSIALLLPPHHPRYWQCQNNVHRHVLNDSINYCRFKLGISEQLIWDYRLMSELSDKDFSDGHHLNASGSEILTTKLNDRILESISSEVVESTF